MGQTTSHKGVEANLPPVCRNRPALCLSFCCLIRHNSYRTILAIRAQQNSKMKPNCYSVIIAGGKGTRFWPLSRSRRPKQLLKILSAKSLLVETAERAFSLSGRRQTLVVTVAEQLSALRRELRALPARNFLAEPEGKNTAPCIGLAALEVIRRNPDAVMIVLPADHWVADVKAFQRTLRSAADLAGRHDQLITVGIRPDYPETGYGYIMKGKALDPSTRAPALAGGSRSGFRPTGLPVGLHGKKPPLAFHVKRFTEKPSLGKARRLMRQGSLWNSGIFVWKAATLLELLARYQPEIAKGLEFIGKAVTGRSLSSPTLRPVVAREYRKMPSVSIDYAVLEPAGSEGRVLTLEADFGWSDVGSWAAVHRMMHKDAHGNAGNGRWLGFGARNCLVHASARLVVLLGVENAVVVDTPDALLVGDLRRSQEVRGLVEELNKRGYGSYTVN